MKFEHLIEINDPLNPLIDTLSRHQLWQGLVLRAEQPKLFVPHLDDCTWERCETGSTLQRQSRYGELIIYDHVSFAPQHQVVYQVAPQKDIAASSLTMTIEEPQPELFFVRFLYEDRNDEATDEANKMYDEFRRSAYLESDIDTIRVIRELAALGRLNTC